MPVTPDDFKSLIPAPNTPICPKVIQQLVELPTKLWNLVSEMKNPDGTISDAFKAAIGLTVGGLAAPANLVASDGVGTSVALTWSPVTGAISYQVFRSLTNDTTTAGTAIGSPSATSYSDASAVSGQTYWYWVKAVNAGGVSDFSTGDSGHWGATTSTPIHYYSTQDVPIPAGWATIAVTVYGDGGGGGGGSFNPVIVGGVGYGGGGGGSGGKTTVTGIAVTTGNTIRLQIGTGGNGGASASTGTSGQGSTVINATTLANIAQAGGGGGGGAGVVIPPGSTPPAGSAGSGGTTVGNAGHVGAINTGGVGGTGVDGYGAGGAGGNLVTAGTAGSIGHVVITPNG